MWWAVKSWKFYGRLSGTAFWLRWTTSSTTGSYVKVSLMSAVQLNERPQITCLMQFKASPLRHMSALSQAPSASRYRHIVQCKCNAGMHCTNRVANHTFFLWDSKQHHTLYICVTTGFFSLKLLTYYSQIYCWQAPSLKWSSCVQCECLNRFSAAVHIFPVQSKASRCASYVTFVSPQGSSLWNHWHLVNMSKVIPAATVQCVKIKQRAANHIFRVQFKATLGVIHSCHHRVLPSEIIDILLTCWMQFWEALCVQCVNKQRAANHIFCVQSKATHQRIIRSCHHRVLPSEIIDILFNVMLMALYHLWSMWVCQKIFCYKPTFCVQFKATQHVIHSCHHRVLLSGHLL